MKTSDIETSIKEFLELGRKLLSQQVLTGKDVLNELIAWYTDNRVNGASLTESSDMLLLEWGSTFPIKLTEPTDLRKVSDSELQFLKTKYQFLGFTRQLFPNNEEGTLEFDDEAVQLCITLCYEEATGNEPSSNLWIETPNEIESSIKKFHEVPFVSKLFSAPVKNVIVVVQFCG